LKISIQKNILEKILINSQAFTEKRDLTQITSHLLIQVQNNTFTVKATDYEIGLQTVLHDISYTEEGIATANSKKFADIVKNLKDDSISIYTEEQFLVIEQGNAQFKIPTFIAGEFPKFPTIKTSEQILLENTILGEQIRMSLPSADNNNPKHELNAILLDLQDSQYLLVSTDTKRLSIVSHQEAPKLTQKAIISKKSALEIQKILNNESKIYINKTHLIIENTNTTFFTKLMSGEYPRYEAIIPGELKYKIELPKQEILDNLHMIASLSNTVTFSIHSSGIQLTTGQDAQSQAKIDLAINTNISSFLMHANVKYFIDFLNVTKNNTFFMELDEENSPFVLISDNHKIVIMPVII